MDATASHVAPIVRFKRVYQTLKAVASSDAPMSVYNREAMLALMRAGQVHVIRLNAVKQALGGGGGASVSHGPPQVLKGLGSWSTWWSDITSEAASAAQGAWSTLSTDAGKAWTWVETEAGDLWNEATQTSNQATQTFQNAENFVGQKISDASNAVGNELSSVGQSVSDTINRDIAQPVQNWTRDTKGFLEQLAGEAGAGAKAAWDYFGKIGGDVHEIVDALEIGGIIIVGALLIWALRE